MKKRCHLKDQNQYHIFQEGIPDKQGKNKGKLRTFEEGTSESSN